ncbi:HNH endonuclease [Serratia quinivorans]|uniref:HNH endonuclease n=1 Tax=Serratia quinivorans TaxID=137545 RepID=UPI0021799BAF|nr:HNH endonuclease [Serratia quinivorans]CAI1785508.1 HNH endonuclease [Serratia quinivorans]
MRPVRKGISPIGDIDFDDYKKAFPHLVGRIGSYCSYCERRIATNLAVEHIQPKDGQYGHPGLTGRWSNFLLACVNCNSTKGAKEVILSNLLLPDRDNTFYAYVYSADGKVAPAAQLSPAQQAIAQETLSLTGLDKKVSQIFDDNGKLVALDRESQRKEAWGTAQEALSDVLNNPGNTAVLRLTAVLAKETGFFSIWMTVFSGQPTMLLRIIEAFEGTAASGCFDAIGVSTVPAPNPDRLANGSKV